MDCTNTTMQPLQLFLDTTGFLLAVWMFVSGFRLTTEVPHHPAHAPAQPLSANLCLKVLPLTYRVCSQLKANYGPAFFSNAHSGRRPHLVPRHCKHPCTWDSSFQ
ncbi:hypothetical protein CEXT_790291 [Caerostris extrusa]|uniref:Secreted protein n=1 Tax=Caerostris extrusa TaxID=172846 RepID=A0AAV4V9Z2_CAEEX|nr:hypothetical protein CEXT_790291 [Caerostris extrusa]